MKHVTLYNTKKNLEKKNKYHETCNTVQYQKEFKKKTNT